MTFQDLVKFYAFFIPTYPENVICLAEVVKFVLVLEDSFERNPHMAPQSFVILYLFVILTYPENLIYLP